MVRLPQNSMVEKAMNLKPMQVLKVWPPGLSDFDKPLKYRFFKRKEPWPSHRNWLLMN